MSLKKGVVFVPATALQHYWSEASLNSWPESWNHAGDVQDQCPVVGVGGLRLHMAQHYPLGSQLYGGVDLLGGRYYGWDLDFIFCFCNSGLSNSANALEQETITVLSPSL